MLAPSSLPYPHVHAFNPARCRRYAVTAPKLPSGKLKWETAANKEFNYEKRRNLRPKHGKKSRTDAKSSIWGERGRTFRLLNFISNDFKSTGHILLVNHSRCYRRSSESS